MGELGAESRGVSRSLCCALSHGMAVSNICFQYPFVSLPLGYHFLRERWIHPHLLLRENPSTVPAPKSENKKKIAFFRACYRLLGIAMVGLPVLAWIFAYNSGHLGFWLEMAGVSAFGTYWLMKTIELRWSQVEHKALTGQLAMDPQTLM